MQPKLVCCLAIISFLAACATPVAKVTQADDLTIAQTEWELEAALNEGRLGAPIKGQALPQHNLTHKNNTGQERVFYLAGRILTAAAPLCGENVQPDYLLGVRIKPQQSLQVSIPLAVKAFDERNNIEYGDYVVGVDGVPLHTGLLGFRQLAAIETVGIRENRPLTLNLERGRARLPVTVRIAPVKRCAYDVNYIHNRAINAFANGESINFHSGLVDLLQDDHDLAWVVAHETAHNILGHSQRGSYNRSLGLLTSLLLSVLLEDRIGTGWEDQFSQISQDFVQYTFTPAQEKEADYVAAYLLIYAGFKPENVMSGLEKMAVDNPEMIHDNGDHPGAAERIANARLTVVEIKQKQAADLPLFPELMGTATKTR